MGFGDLEYAQKLRDVIREIVRSEVNLQRPKALLATVDSVDAPNSRCMVKFPGDDQAVPVKMFTIRPTAPGDVVRVEGDPGSRYISEVVSGSAAIEAVSTNFNIANYRLNQLSAPNAAVAMGGQKLTNLGAPTAGTDATTKTYVDTEVGKKANTSHTHTKSQISDFAHTHPLGDIVAAGVLDSTTFLRGDGTWATPPDTNTTYANPTQAEAEAGTATTQRAWTAQRVAQAIAALSPVKSVAGKTGVVTLQKSNITDFAHTHTKSDITDFAHTHGVADISATGSRSASTYLRGDGQWVTPPDTNTTYDAPSQAEAETGTATTQRAWTAQRVAQAIAALSPVKSVAGKTGVVTLQKANITDFAHTHPFGEITGAARLGQFAQSISDWNEAVENGWYMASDGMNAPSAGWYIGTVEAHNATPGWCIQTVYPFTAAGIMSGTDTGAYKRVRQNGTWGAWYRLRLSEVELDARYQQNIAAGATTQYWRGDKSWQTLNKAAVGLTNVDNTSDANKPISTATQTALNAKENSIAAGTTAQYWRGDKSWQTLNKASVGLANVDNTSDASKPVSTATQTALNAKANVGHTHPVSDIDSGMFPPERLGTNYVGNGTKVLLDNMTWGTVDDLPGGGGAGLATLPIAYSNMGDDTFASLTTAGARTRDAGIAAAGGGKFVVIGGRATNNNILYYINVFDIATQTWEVERNNQTTYPWSASCYSPGDGKFYMTVSGQNYIYLYDPVLQTSGWKTTSSGMGLSHTGLNPLVCDGTFIYLLGSSGTANTTGWKFNISTNTSSTFTLPTASNWNYFAEFVEGFIWRWYQTTNTLQKVGTDGTVHASYALPSGTGSVKGMGYLSEQSYIVLYRGSNNDQYVSIFDLRTLTWKPNVTITVVTGSPAVAGYGDTLYTQGGRSTVYNSTTGYYSTLTTFRGMVPAYIKESPIINSQSPVVVFPLSANIGVRNSVTGEAAEKGDFVVARPSEPIYPTGPDVVTQAATSIEVAYIGSI